MNRKLKVIVVSAALGFMLAWAVLGYSCICFHWRCQFNETLALVLCPACVLAIGLDNASFAGALFGWLVIALSNMALYLGIGAIISNFVSSSGKSVEPRAIP